MTLGAGKKYIRDWRPTTSKFGPDSLSEFYPEHRTGHLSSHLSLRRIEWFAKIYERCLRDGPVYKIAHPLLIHWFRRMRNVINFSELAAALPRSDWSRYRSVLQTTARLHPRQSRSIYFSHDTSKEPRARRQGTPEKERERKKQLLHAETLWALAVNRGRYPGIVRLICYDVSFSRSVPKMIANAFQRVSTIHALGTGTASNLMTTETRSWSLTLSFV